MKTKFFYLLILHFSFFIFHSSIANAIEVGGHLTQDTTWSPENNPYEVTEVLYVDEGVTLTILPGTEIKILGAPFVDVNGFANFTNTSGNPIAKFIWVDGRIIAEGTEEEQITFTRLQDEDEYYWGTIYITELADMCRFQYCKFEYSVQMIISLGNIANGALAVYNKTGVFRNNIFLNNYCGIMFQGTPLLDVEISDNTFGYTENINDYLFAHTPRPAMYTGFSISNNIIPLVCNNTMEDSDATPTNSVFAYNKLYNPSSNFESSTAQAGSRSSYIYKNSFENTIGGIVFDGDGSYIYLDSLFIKENIFNCTSDGIDIDYAHAEIMNNSFEGCNLKTWGSYSSRVINNSFNNYMYDRAIISGNIDVYSNNIIRNSNVGLSGVAYLQNSNNIFLNINEIYGVLTEDSYYENLILLNNGILNDDCLYGNPTFRNCILDFELPEGCIDGGGNIWVTPEEAEQIFVDIENGDFHLAEGSIAIDAGFDTLGYYYPFDFDYSQRIWDGNGDGNAVIDIGPYEFGAPQLGTISGYITESTTGEPVKYVLIKPNDNSSDFVVSDSTGYFEIQLAEGNYDLHCQRVFYESTIEYDVNVQDEDDTQIAFTMTDILPPVGLEEECISFNSELKTSNYPNPFNPSTTIKYFLQKDSFVNLSIYNIKGQIVKTLVSSLKQKGNNSIVWNGKDDAGTSVSSGVYFYKVQTAEVSTTKKILMLK